MLRRPKLNVLGIRIEKLVLCAHNIYIKTNQDKTSGKSLTSFPLKNKDNGYEITH